MSWAIVLSVDNVRAFKRKLGKLGC